jgi:hypothetical protein
MVRLSIAIAGFVLAMLLSIPALAQTRALVTEEMMVKTSDPGIEIYVRNKRPADMTSFRPEQTVLYVHGATYPSETAFDLKLDGLCPLTAGRRSHGLMLEQPTCAAAIHFSLAEIFSNGCGR